MTEIEKLADGNRLRAELAALRKDLETAHSRICDLESQMVNLAQADGVNPLWRELEKIMRPGQK